MSRPLTALAARWRGRYRRTAAYLLGRRTRRMHNRGPIITFTFDDFPRSALQTGGAILENEGVAGTYYASLGLMGRNTATGEIFQPADVPGLLRRGHELGCHTFSHCHAYDTPPESYEASIRANRETLATLAPAVRFETHAYPISCPRPATKRRTGRYFSACRGGGQTHNCGWMDANNLRAFFLEQSRDHPGRVKAAIDDAARAGAWLIFATHDVCDHPTRFGCEPDFFAEIVRYAVRSGAQILPVSAALTAIGGREPNPSCALPAFST